MEKIHALWGHRFFRITVWIVLVLICLYVVLVIVRTVHLFEEDKINAQVEKIHNTKLSINDVMGTNLPPDPGEEADKTVQGVDANTNGIRDDVELAIFREYPDSAKTRAVLLQYALALQMEMTQAVVNMETVTAVAEETSRAGSCIADILVPRKTSESSRSYDDLEKINSFTGFVNSKQLNTEARKIEKKNFYTGKLGSYELPSGCDIDLSILPN